MKTYTAADANPMSWEEYGLAVNALLALAVAAFGLFFSLFALWELLAPRRAMTVGRVVAIAAWLHGGPQRGPLRTPSGELPATGRSFSAPYVAMFTFAPEAGSQRMRDVVNKNVTEEQLMETARRVAEAASSLRERNARRMRPPSSG